MVSKGSRRRSPRQPLRSFVRASPGGGLWASFPGISLGYCDFLVVPVVPVSVPVMIATVVAIISPVAVTVVVAAAVAVMVLIAITLFLPLPSVPVMAPVRNTAITCPQKTKAEQKTDEFLHVLLPIFSPSARGIRGTGPSKSIRVAPASVLPTLCRVSGGHPPPCGRYRCRGVGPLSLMRRPPRGWRSVPGS